MIVLSSNARFGGTIRLESLAYDIALAIRNAQVYGIAVRQYEGTFQSAYGMHFEQGNPNTYTLFVDAVVENGRYDCSGSCELIEVTTLQGGYRIVDLHVRGAGDSSPTCEATEVDELHIAFKRPEPDALISADSASCLTTPVECRESACITIASPRGDTNHILIEATGQISVQ